MQAGGEDQLMKHDLEKRIERIENVERGATQYSLLAPRPRLPLFGLLGELIMN
jgi:hypothetical protein